MKAIVDKQITILNPTQQARSELKQLLEFPNPEYAKKEQMGKWTGGIPRTLSLIKSYADSIVIPFGMLWWVFRNVSVQDLENHAQADGIGSFGYGTTIVPYPYQEDAIRAAISKRNGVIVAPCGSGKTQIGLEIIRRLGGRALWLTHTEDLLKQSMERAKSTLDLPETDYGTITAGKVNVGKVITFATVQTMVNIDLAEQSRLYDIVIVDEAHHIVGTPTRMQMFYKVVSALAARYKFGLTATPRRQDGLIGCMYAVLGEQLYEITRQQVKEHTCPVRVHFQNTSYSPDFAAFTDADGTLNYNNLVTDLCGNKLRNERILDDVRNIPGASLVLTDRVSHVKYIADELGDDAIELSAKSRKDVRKAALDAIRSGEKRVLVATYALAREGLDLPNLCNVFMTTPQKNETTVVQSAGRVERKFPGKEYGNVYDYVDDFGIAVGWSRKRAGFYKKCEFTIV